MASLSNRPAESLCLTPILPIVAGDRFFVRGLAGLAAFLALWSEASLALVVSKESRVSFDFEAFQAPLLRHL